MVEIEIDGKPLKVEQGTMIIEAADQAGIPIPRFCYHKKLSIAANCRMCLVEVEKMGKPVPACATTVTPEMKVFTQSAKAKQAQRGVMEYLLINHPLDCPICDQGGECELQDNSMGYGNAVSDYREPKRAVFDEDLGPLVQTAMTRCIHCTRCVRFGEEIAGLRELGVTFRGEHMQIGTYVKHIMQSELSANIIDLCPVGALTSKPFRYAARAWEMREHPGIAAHDCVGSNLYLHSRSQEYTDKRQILRVVPREKEAINEIWLSDRDRFSYLGLYHTDRLAAPWLRNQTRGQYTDWPTALNTIAGQLQDFLQSHSADELAIIVSPNATLEELYLLQKLARALGCPHIDHRLRQTDWSDQADWPAYPNAGLAFTEIDNLTAVLLVGSDIQREQPILGYRVSKAAQEGAAIMAVNPQRFDSPFALQAAITSFDLVSALSAIVAAIYEQMQQPQPAWLQAEISPEASAIANTLRTTDRAWIVLGELAHNHPQAANIRALTALISQQTGAQWGMLTAGANTAGAWLAGAVPHRAAANQLPPVVGLSLPQLIEQPRKAYWLWGVEPEFDCAFSQPLLQALHQAEWVISFNSFATERMQHYVSAILPLATAYETEGTFVNAAGEWQSFTKVTEPPAQARAGWKVLKVLAELLDLEGFRYEATAEIAAELAAKTQSMVTPDSRALLVNALGQQPLPAPLDGLWRLAPTPIYRVDALVRRAAALQEIATYPADVLQLNSKLAQTLGLTAGCLVRAQQGASIGIFTLEINDQLADQVVLLPAAMDTTAGFGHGHAAIALTLVEAEETSC